MNQPLTSVQEMLDFAAARDAVDPAQPIESFRAACDADVIALHHLVRSTSGLLVRDVLVPSIEGPISARLYLPSDAAELAVHVHLHGGGWWMCSVETTDPMAREIALRSGAAVISVDYRLAPEHPFPAALHDVLAVVRWLESEPSELGFRVRALTLGGESAGANLAAAAALMLRDAGDSPLDGLWLDVPAVDLTLPASKSMEAYFSGYGLEGALLPIIVHWYAAGEDLTNPYLSPAHADLSGLPSTIVTTAEFDPLRDQGEDLAHAMTKAGVRVHHMRALGHVHASGWLTALEGYDHDWHAEVMRHLCAMHSDVLVGNE